MAFLSVFLLVILVVTAIFLIFFVLIQQDGGDGIGSLFGAESSTNQLLSRSGNILTRMTAILGGIFMLTAFGLAWINRTPDVGEVENFARLQEREQTEQWWTVDEEEEE